MPLASQFLNPCIVWDLCITSDTSKFWRGKQCSPLGVLSTNYYAVLLDKAPHPWVPTKLCRKLDLHRVSGPECQSWRDTTPMSGGSDTCPSPKMIWHLWPPWASGPTCTQHNERPGVRLPGRQTGKDEELPRRRFFLTFLTQDKKPAQQVKAKTGRVVQ